MAGQLRPARDSVEAGALPLGLTGGAKVVRPVPADAILARSDVSIDEDLAAARLRRETEALACTP